MSEAIGEMILPGTYIEVRAEGLIGVGGIATGNIGVVGTANRGPLNTVVILGSYTEALDTFGSYDRWPGTDIAPALTLTRTLEQLFKGGGSTIYAVRVANLAADTDMKSMSWTLADGADAALAVLTATSPGTWANAITTKLDAPAGKPVTLELVFGRNKESYVGATTGEIVAAINDGSRVVTAALAGADDDAKQANAAKAPAKITAGDAGGPDGVGATTTELAAGLDKLATQPINLVVAGGFDAKTAAATMLAHLEATENDGRERIGVIGASSDALDKIVSDDVSKGSNPRLVLVAPGIVADDAARAGEKSKRVKLTAPYAAALVAGRIATLAPHISMTNKDVAADDLTRDYTRAEQKQLLNNRVFVLQKNLGIRALKGITTDAGAFKQISVRRIVDYAKAGVRLGSNPYIGRLNNSRVRAALKATLDGFLAGMVLDEMLIAYSLDVSATRAQEINGQAIVIMTLQPTFSIDFVKVIMNLG
jgi:Phage tail sheath protein subtilisin-like domain/Phage tail sheath C-terminal domain